MESDPGQRSGAFVGVRAIFQYGALSMLSFVILCWWTAAAVADCFVLAPLQVLAAKHQEWGSVPKGQDSHCDLFHVVFYGQEQVSHHSPVSPLTVCP